MDAGNRNHDPVASAQARVAALQKETQRLCEELERVTAQLSVRTGGAVQLTVAHAATADQLAAHCVNSLQHLQNASDTFLEQMAELRGRLHAITSIAKMTQEVRAELITLEGHVNKLGGATSSTMS